LPRAHRDDTTVVARSREATMSEARSLHPKHLRPRAAGWLVRLVQSQGFEAGTT